jgi:hypothetical protein
MVTRGHGELEDAAMRLIGRGPQNTQVGLDNRSANGEPHPDPLRLGGEEPIKDAVDIRRVKPGAHVRDLH